MATIGRLRPGDRIFVTGRHHGKLLELGFRVTGARTYRKTSLPYKKIFAQHSVGRLAVVTCGGPFDSSTGNYEDNVVVFAVPTGWHAVPHRRRALTTALVVDVAHRIDVERAVPGVPPSRSLRSASSLAVVCSVSTCAGLASTAM